MIENKVSILDSMKSAFSIWKTHFLKIVIVGLIVYLPTQIIIEIVSIQLDRILTFQNTNEMRFVNNIYNLIRYLIGSVALLGIINFSIKILNNEEEQTVREILLHGLKKWGDFIGVGFFASLKIILYTLLLILPGIYKAVRLSFIDCIVATNENIFKDACNESERLVQNQWWRVFGFVLLLFLCESLFELLFIFPLISYSESHIISILLGTVIKVLETYFIVVRANYFFNLSKIKSQSITENITVNNEVE